MSQELIPRQTITMIVENVEAAKEEIRQGLELLMAAKARVRATLGGSPKYYDKILEDRFSDYDLDPEFKASKNVIGNTQQRVVQNAWRYILDQTGLNHFMTEKRQKELREQIDKNELPELTVENIIGTLQGLTGKIDGLLLESIKEVFDWLRPQNDWGTGALKTNHKFHVGRKAIVGWAIERNYSGGFRVNYHRDGNFRALGNVFSLLDGKGVVKYPHDLYTRFNEAMKQASAGAVFEDEYFRMKCYGNGNLHIEFKREDLLAKLNQMGSDGSLPGKEAA